MKTLSDIIIPQVAPINHILKTPTSSYVENTTDASNSQLLASLDQQIKGLKESAFIADDMSSISSHDVHQYVVMYLLVTGAGVAAVTFVWCRCRQQPASSRPITSAPRVVFSARKQCTADRQPSVSDRLSTLRSSKNYLKLNEVGRFNIKRTQNVSTSPNVTKQVFANCDSQV